MTPEIQEIESDKTGMKINNSRGFDLNAVAAYIYHELLNSDGTIENNEIAIHIKGQMSPISVSSRSPTWSIENISDMRDSLKELENLR